LNFIKIAALEDDEIEYELKHSGLAGAASEQV
jgi:hypothetical protein